MILVKRILKLYWCLSIRYNKNNLISRVTLSNTIYELLKSIDLSTCKTGIEKTFTKLHMQQKRIELANPQ